MIEQGIYQHFKGRRYDVIGVAINRDGGPDLVIYRPCYGDRKLTYRTVTEFTETIERDGYKGPRFFMVISNQEGPK